MLLLVHDGHGHVTHGAARLVHGVLGARWHGDRDRVQHGVHGVLGHLRRLLAALLIVLVSVLPKNLILEKFCSR